MSLTDKITQQETASPTPSTASTSTTPEPSTASTAQFETRMATLERAMKANTTMARKSQKSIERWDQEFVMVGETVRSTNAATQEIKAQNDQLRAQNETLRELLTKTSTGPHVESSKPVRIDADDESVRSIRNGLTALIDEVTGKPDDPDSPGLAGLIDQAATISTRLSEQHATVAQLVSQVEALDHAVSAVPDSVNTQVTELFENRQWKDQLAVTIANRVDIPQPKIINGQVMGADGKIRTPAPDTGGAWAAVGRVAAVLVPFAAVLLALALILGVGATAFGIDAIFPWIWESFTAADHWWSKLLIGVGGLALAGGMTVPVLWGGEWLAREASGKKR